MKNRALHGLVEIPVPFQAHRIAVALAQLSGPSDAKQLSYVEGRETYHWKSEEEVRHRLQKLEHILDHITRESRHTDLLVFPEYSLPVEPALQILQEFADANETVVIGGSDNIRSGRGKIYNQCPVLVPRHKRPVWIRKRDVSQWELTKVDPSRGPNPIFGWRAGGKHYWFSVHICLDFLSVLDEPVHKLTSPGFMVVPMCSQEIITMRNYADTLLRPASGRACLLCNTVDNFSIGNSCVMAVTPDGKALQPAIEIPRDGEFLLAFELDCAHLAPPKKSPVRPISPLNESWTLARILPSLGGFDFRPETITSRRPSIGIINPEVFHVRGLRMRLAFRGVKNYTELAERNKDRGFEILAVLGQEDLVISHLARSEYEFRFDLHEMGLDDDVPAREGRQHLSYFEVDTYFKVLGKELTEEERGVFEGGNTNPSDEEFAGIFALGQNWNTDVVSDDQKRSFVDRRWILGETRAVPGDISAVMTITLLEPGNREQGIFDQFEREVLPSIVKRSEVTSVYGGTGKRGHIDYVLRITADLAGLYPIIQFVHGIANSHRMLMTTTTYVVVHRISSLALLEASSHSGDRLHYVFHFLRRLVGKDKDAFRALREERQNGTTLLFERAERALLELPHPNPGDADFAVQKTLDLLAHTLVNDRAELFMDGFTRLHLPAEHTLDLLLDGLENQFEMLAERVKLPPGKTRDKLTYGEKIRLLREALRVPLDIDVTERALASLSHTVAIRNSFYHPKGEKITLEALVAAIEQYGEFYRLRRK